MAHLAKSIKIARIGMANGQPVMVIDGEEFPYFTAEGYKIEVRRKNLCGVTLTIAAESVEVVDTVNAAKLADDETAHDRALTEALRHADVVGA